MHSRLFLLSTAVFISIFPAIALADSDKIVSYTLQVGAFPNTDLADRFVANLIRAGEQPTCVTVDLEGRGNWTRVFVGVFSTNVAARSYGESLIARGIINEFLIKNAELYQTGSRARRVGNLISARPQESGEAARDLSQQAKGPNLSSRYSVRPKVSVKPEQGPGQRPGSRLLPVVDFRSTALNLAPDISAASIPRPDPVSLAFRLIVGEPQSRALAAPGRGGLWLTGDTAEGLQRLRWIVGAENGDLIKVERDGRVQLDRRLFAKLVGLEDSRVDDPVQVADYISSNEGLLLLVQLTEGRYHYCIHIGRQVPTNGKSIEITGSINLDTNFDSRINPYRKEGKKLDSERPPKGFESLVALNPAARWFNLNTNSWVQSGEILFHELAEAYAKLEFGLDYLEHGSEPGAHAIALDRERRLKLERPSAHIVMTAGSNRVLRTEEEIRLFYSESASGTSQR